MFGKSDDSDKNSVYIGQAGSRKNGEGILNRILEHKRNVKKDYFTEIVCFTTIINSFGPTEISYLENRFCELAKDANRYEIKNAASPNLANVTEEKESELEEFIDYAKIIMGTLAHKVFEPIAISNLSEVRADEDDDNLLYLERTTLKSETAVKGIGMTTDEGFVVLKGSIIERKDSSHISGRLIEIRKNAKFDGNILAEDILFSSPSAAAMFVLGASASGPREWKDKSGRRLKDI